MARPKITAEELLARAESKGYKKGAHFRDDCKRDERKHVDKTKKDQNSALGCYVLMRLHEELA
jgi:hypothetical protein